MTVSSWVAEDAPLWLADLFIGVVVILDMDGATREGGDHIIGFTVLAIMMALFLLAVRGILQWWGCRRMLREVRDHWEEWAPDCWPPLIQEAHTRDWYPKLVRTSALNPTQPVLTLDFQELQCLDLPMDTNTVTDWSVDGLRKLSRYLAIPLDSMQLHGDDRTYRLSVILPLRPDD